MAAKSRRHETAGDKSVRVQDNCASVYPFLHELKCLWSFGIAIVALEQGSMFLFFPRSRLDRSCGGVR